MTLEVTEVHLFNVARGEAEVAELWHAITEQQLADWEGEWVPELFRAMQRLRRAGVERTHWPQSRHWDWRKKVAVLQAGLAAPKDARLFDEGVRFAARSESTAALTPEEGAALEAFVAVLSEQK